VHSTAESESAKPLESINVTVMGDVIDRRVVLEQERGLSQQLWKLEEERPCTWRVLQERRLARLFVLEA